VRENRDFRLMVIGQTISGLGTQAALVALPYQIYVISHSATLVGLLGAFELGPMIVVSLIGGALADRYDRRLVLAAAQVGVFAVVSVLCVLSELVGHPPVAAILILGGLLGGCSALNNVASSAIIPAVLGQEWMRPGIAFSYATAQATSIVGPGLGGLVIAATGVAPIYAFDAVSCVVMLGIAALISVQIPAGAGEEQPPVREAIAEGVRFVVSDRALAGSFLIDINAMTFGMPRALFAVLSLTVYHAGAGGTGLLYAAIAIGGTASVLTSGWAGRARKLGQIVTACVLVWGLAILAAGLVRSIGLAVVFLAIAGWADGISAVCRQGIAQSLTPDRMRGRLGAAFSLVVTSGPRLGDIESGLVAGLAGALNSVVIGGAGCLVGVGAVLLVCPQLLRFDAEEAMSATVAAEAAMSSAPSAAA
jgi:hypothetical protein